MLIGIIWYDVVRFRSESLGSSAQMGSCVNYKVAGSGKRVDWGLYLKVGSVSSMRVAIGVLIASYIRNDRMSCQKQWTV